MSSGWKNVVMFCTSPDRCRGALRYQSSLNARAVSRFSMPGGNTSGTLANCGASNRNGSRRSFAGRSSYDADQPRVSTARPRCLPVATESNQATEYVYLSSSAASRAIRPPRSSVRSVSTRKYAVSTGFSRIVAPSTTPVSPIPPTVAQNRSASVPDGCSVRTTPSAPSRSSDSRWLPNEPSMWWFLPCTSAAIAPPTVTCRVPGTTGSHSPNGSSTRMSVSRLTPASHRTVRAARSTACTVASRVRSSTVPPAFCAASPYARPSPRASTPRGPAFSTTAAASSYDVTGCSTAVLGAVRPQPVSRVRTPGRGPHASGTEHPGTHEREPDRGQPLQDPVVQHDVLRLTGLTGVDVHGVPQHRQHERRDRDRVPGHPVP